jgi:hypothetical protein
MKNEAKREMLRFEIDQLRKDKMIYALESIALTFIVELVYMMMSVLFNVNLPVLAVAGVVVSVGYYIFMVIGNLSRYTKIKKMEKELYKE